MLYKSFTFAYLLTYLDYFESIVYVCMVMHFTADSFNKFKRCYHKSVKMFFGYNKYHSVTASLIDLKLPSFNAVIRNLC